MPALTTISAVQKIIDYNQTLIPDLTPFIDGASTLANNVIGDALDATTMELVERYLAAHLVGITDPRLQSEQVKSIQASYQNKLSDGLGITHWGSMAMLFDTSGKLANWNKSVVDGLAGAFSFIWGGTEPPDAEYYTG